MRTFRQIRLKERDQKAIEAASKLLRERFPVETVILFGSKARGEDNSESDIDLLALTTRHLSWEERDAITDGLFDIELNQDVGISTFVASVTEWEEGVYSVLPMHEEVSQDGVVA